MPVITVARATPVQVSGIAATPHLQRSVGIAEPVMVFGLPAVVLTPPPAASPAPDGVKARVLNSAGTFIAHLPHAQGLRWLDEFNSAGGGSIDTHRYDDFETAHPGVWAAGNQIIVSVGNVDVFRVVLDAEPGYRIDETGSRVDTWSGTGALGILNSGMIFPEYGWRPEALDQRSFDYGSNPAIGGWLVASEWKTPVGVPVRQSWRWTFKKRHLPKGWPEKHAQWIWWKNPDSTNVADEVCYFRSAFTLATAARVKFWVCGDDTLEFQVDGEVRITQGQGNWRKASTIVLYLAAGTHYVAAKVANSPSTDGQQNRSGFLCAIGRINSNRVVTAWLRRSNPSTWTVRRQLSGAPGWYPAQIVKRLVDEQKSRSCAGHSPITFGFSTTVDSSGVAWTGRQELALTVGTLGLEWLQRLVETGLDVAMTPALKLNLWKKRGSDRSSTVRLDQGTARPLDEAAPQPPGIRNTLYARSRTGWVGRTNAASIAASGIRETMVTLGSSRSSAQTGTTLGALLPDLANPPQTIEVKVSGATGVYQPYRDFNVGDWVGYRAAGAATWARHRVMSIAGEVSPAGPPVWSIKLYEDPL